MLDMRVAEIAELLGLTVGGVKHALFRARRSLAGVLATERGDDAVSTGTDDQLRQRLRALAEVTARPADEIERDVLDRAARLRRRRHAAPIVGTLAAAGLAVAVATVVRDDDPADVRLVDEASSSTAPPSTGSSAPPTDDERLLMTTVRLGRHDGFDRVVIEFNTNLAESEATEVDDIATEAGFGPAFAVDDVPNYGECGPAQLSVDGSRFVNVVVPSDWLHPTDPQLQPRYRSPDTVKINEVAVCPPYEGRAHITIALSQPGQIDTTILDNPGRVVIDIR
jgi:hypothetical protein